MTIDIRELINFLAELCEDKNIKAATVNSLKGGLITGVSAVLGGLLLGPVGLAIGGTVGGISAAASSEEFQPVAMILREMSPAQKMKLTAYLVNAFRNFGIEDISTLFMLLHSSSSMQDLALKQLTGYLKNEMSMKIKS